MIWRVFKSCRSVFFTRLKKAGIVEGIEGSRGGFVLAREPEQISVMSVLSAIDPGRTLFECAEIRRNCDLFEGVPPAWSVAGTCRIHLVMQEAEAALRAVLTSKTLADLGREFEHKAPKRFLGASEQWFQTCRGERKGGRVGKRVASCAKGKACASGKHCNISH